MANDGYPPLLARAAAAVGVGGRAMRCFGGRWEMGGPLAGCYCYCFPSASFACVICYVCVRVCVLLFSPPQSCLWMWYVLLQSSSAFARSRLLLRHRHHHHRAVGAAHFSIPCKVSRTSSHITLSPQVDSHPRGQAGMAAARASMRAAAAGSSSSSSSLLTLLRRGYVRACLSLKQPQGRISPTHARPLMHATHPPPPPPPEQPRGAVGASARSSSVLAATANGGSASSRLLRPAAASPSVLHQPQHQQQLGMRPPRRWMMSDSVRYGM
jgi:hypothetical protein